jgi:hypothetical protein
MGLMRFLVPRRDRLAADAIERAYCSGMDDIPWQSRTQWTDDGLAIRRTEHDSGCFHIQWRVAGHGELLLATATLMEREAPYHLTVELARGSLNRLRNQLALWQTVGLVASEATSRQIAKGLEHLARAATRQADPAAADEEAQRSLEVSLAATADLGREYAEQSLAARRRQATKSTTLMGVSLGTSALPDSIHRPLVGTFNTGSVPLSWREVERQEGRRDWTLSDRQIEWCRAKGLKVCAGPLLQLDRCAAPDWLYLWEGEFDNLTTFATDYLRTAVSRYRGKVHLWQCSARLNATEVFSLSEEQRLRLAVLAIEVTRQTDPRAPVVLMIDQPWAEFMADNECDLSPLHFADALVRAELGLSGIGLEINFGYSPGGSQVRDVLEFSRLLDRWSLLGLPLLVMLTLPSSSAADPLARSPAQPLPYAAAGGATPESQREWIEQFVPMLLAKQPVQGIFWNQLSDSVPHDFAHGGLFDAAGQAKPVVEAFRNLRQQFVA